MSPVIAARDARRARNAVPITIGPRDLASAAIEIHDATRAYEPGFVTVEHAEDSRVRDAIDVADDALTLQARDLHAGKGTEVVEAARRSRGAHIARIAA